MHSIRKASLATMAALLVATIGCGGSPEKKFIGKWVSDPFTVGGRSTVVETFVIFKEDGEAVYGLGNDDQGRSSYYGDWTVSDSNEKEATFRVKFVDTFVIGRVTLVDDDTIKLNLTGEGGPKHDNEISCKRVK